MIGSRKKHRCLDMIATSKGQRCGYTWKLPLSSWIG